MAFVVVAGHYDPIGQLQQQLELGWFTLERIFSYQLNALFEVVDFELYRSHSRHFSTEGHPIISGATRTTLGRVQMMKTREHLGGENSRECSGENQAIRSSDRSDEDLEFACCT
jgi:hypothetical protein